MPVGIETIEVVNGEALGLRMLRKSIDGKSHKILVVKEDRRVNFGVVLYRNTRNIQATRSKIKWVLGTPNEDGEWDWIGWSGPDQSEMLIDGQLTDEYAASTSVIVHTDEGALNIGRPYWLEAFIMNPELPEADVPKGVYVVFLGEPQITTSVFTKINTLRNTEDEVGEGQIFDYGEILKIDINTHLVISRDDIHIKCTLGGKELEFQRILHPKFKDDLKYNGTATLHLHIDPKWRDEVGHGEGEIKELVVLVDIITLEAKNEQRAQQKTVKIDNTRVARRPMQFAPRRTPSEAPDYEGDALKASYSFQVNYMGNREVITERNKGVAQMVSVLDTKVVRVQSDKPCRYTSILVKEVDKDGKESRMFIPFAEQGNGKVTDDTSTVYAIVAGKNKNKKDVKIKVGGVKTTACIAYEQEHDTKGIFETFKRRANEQWLTPDQYDIKKDEVVLHLTYPYLVRNSLGLLKYIWPGHIIPISYFVPVQTCAYPTQGVQIAVYPDIKWQIKFAYGTKNPAFYGDSWVRMTPHRVDDAVNRTQAAAIDGYDGELNMSFDLALSAKWDGSNEAIEFTVNYVNQIKRFIGIFLKVKRIVDKLAYADKGAAATKGLAGISAKFKQRLLRKPITLEIFYPKFEVSAEWGYVASEQNFNAYLAPEGKIGFSPLIGGVGALDLIALSENIPVAGQVIKALDLAASVLNVDPVFELQARGTVNLDIEMKPNARTESSDYSISLNGKLGLRLLLSVKASGEVDAIIFKADFSLHAEGYAESYIEPRVKGGNDENGVYVEAAMDFTGVTITLSIKAEGNVGIFGGSRSKQRDFQVVERKPDILKGKHYFIKK